MMLNYVPKLITDDRSLIAASSSYITIGILSNIFNYPATVYKNSLQGINDERWTFISSSIISFISLGIIYLFSISAKMGLHGIYLGFFIYYLILTITFLIRYLHITNKYEENEEVIRN
jgi:MATE family multidrug resistance protein